MSESCPRTIEISAYLDDELGVAERTQLQAHLAGCERCGVQLARLGALRAEFRALPEERLGFDLSAVIGHRLAAAPKPRAAPPRWRWRQFMPIGLGAGAALSLGLVMGTGLMAGSGGVAAPRVAALAVFDPAAPGSLCAGSGCRARPAAVGGVAR
ncbi:MAG TPA: zf-HC2 domain-containing protein [Rubrivivax sp.]|nr:zf-HC2 domain-containing protein [Rubrivivax sp.]HPO18968.1 zf-HC2 domain-containing protein [Rubrivivax sp.]